MSIDFKKLQGDLSSDTATDPRQIFGALPLKKASRYPYLRDVQAEVLDGWYKRRGEQDLIVKMNTGSGKTVVGLLMLKSLLNEGLGPAVYVSADKYLQRQVVDEARRLGIATVTEPKASQYSAVRRCW